MIHQWNNDDSSIENDDLRDRFPILTPLVTVTLRAFLQVRFSIQNEDSSSENEDSSMKNEDSSTEKRYIPSGLVACALSHEPRASAAFLSELQKVQRVVESTYRSTYRSTYDLLPPEREGERMHGRERGLHIGLMPPEIYSGLLRSETGSRVCARACVCVCACVLLTKRPRLCRKRCSPWLICNEHAYNK